MSSYIQSFADFVQKKENDVNRVVSMQDLEDEDDMPSRDETPNPPKSSSIVKRSATNAHIYTGVGNAGSPNSNSCNKMEHSYTRDTTTNARPLAELTTGLAPARTILVRRPPQCPSCHTHPLEEHELEDTNRVPVPGYNELAAKDVMSESTRISKFEKNSNCDEDDWAARVNQLGWSNAQKTLFEKVVRILDDDQLGRLANAGRQHEAMQRRVIIDKSATSMRRAFTRVLWDTRLTQWLHAIMMEVLPESYMPSYLDVMQTLNAKLPALMDKILFARTQDVSKDLLAPIMKPQWEPMINATKSRKLTQNAVIVALPSAPSSGPVPNRLQQWYHQLATITQIVQVTLPMTSDHVMRQPLEQIAEQIVSLTRVKIQEIRAENAQRNIILLGFNAGAALALQVAMSETVACIVCMGFAYHTFNGVRGMPDDRILEIKSPILFVIGQNSARSSTEELESLREKMVSETSLIVVGSADDMLRVPKSRRKIENVTQAMVDTMVVDEVYEFINKSLTNPPGPRIPTNYTGQLNSKHNKTGVALVAPGDGKTPGTQQRKRKQDSSGALEGGDNTASKTRCTNVGRPRTRPLPTVGTIAKGASGFSNLSVQQQRAQLAPSSSPALSIASGSGTLTNDDLNTAIQSILDDSTLDQQDSYGSTGVTISSKQVTNFELVTSSKTSPNKLPLHNSSMPAQQIVGRQSSVSPTVGTKFKMIPSNQFVQLKPPLQSQSKIYTIKTSAMLNQAQSTGGSSSGATNIVTTASGTTPLVSSGQQQIFTLKSPNGKTTQFVTAAPAAAQQKYTVMKNATGGTTLQLTAKKAGGAAGGSIDFSNIIDMPIIFADNEGNLTDAVGAGDAAKAERAKSAAITSPTTPKSSTSGVGQLIISQKIIKEANIVAGSAPAKVATYAGTIQPQQPKIINSGVGGGAFGQSGTGNKPKQLVFINRNSMKPCPNIISRSALATQLPKYTKLVVQNPSSSSAGSPIASAIKHVNLQALRSPAISGSSGLAIRPASTTNTPASGILNVPTKSLPQIQIIGSTATAASTTTAVTAGSPRNNGGQPIRNIVLKAGGLKHIPEHLKTQLFNRNLTVRKLVNLVPGSKSAVTVMPTSSSSSVVAAQADTEAANSSISTSAIQQTSPKIITLNPINPSAVATPSVTTDS